MSIDYKRLTADRVGEFIALRIAQLREEGAKEDIDLAPALKSYYERHMQDDTFISWLALDWDRIIGTSGISIVEKPPYFSCPSGRIALLSSMYTAPEYRWHSKQAALSCCRRGEEKGLRYYTDNRF